MAESEERDYGIEGWDRSETNAGIPYYINHYTEKTQWDHPHFVKTMETLDTLNNIKYAAYRTAMKLRLMQKFLKFHLVTMSTITSVLEQHGYIEYNDSVMDVIDLQAITTDIYYMTKQFMPRHIDIPLHSDLLLNWILNLFDMGRTGCLRVLSVKIALVALCSARITDKYRYFFHQISNASGIITRKEMTAFLQDMMQIVDGVYENSSFQGVNAVNNALTNVMETCIGSPLTEDRVMKWMMAEPETLVWFPTMHRLSASETMKHEVKCNICKAYPVVGFRYKCLKCFNFDLCQECFFTNRSSKNHKYTHPTQEFVIAASTKDDAKAFAKTVRNRFSKKHRRRFKPNYLLIPPTSDYDSSYETDLNRSDSEMHLKIEKLTKRLAEVEAVSSPYKVDKPQQTDGSLLKDYVKQHSVHSSRTSLASPKEIRQLKELIKHLEHENSILLHEIEFMRRKDMTGSETSKITAEHWKEEHEEMKARQEVLLEHNKQLELQIQRLRHFVTQEQRYPKHTVSMYAPPSPRYQPPVPRHPPGGPLGGPPGKGRLDRTAPPKLASQQQHISQSSGIAMTDSREHPQNSREYPQNSREYPQTSQSQIGYDEIDSRLLPPHLVNQSTIHFPSANASRVYPSEEAELDDLLQRLNIAYPLDSSSGSYHGDSNDMLFAAKRVGEAMTSFVSRATKC